MPGPTVNIFSDLSVDKKSPFDAAKLADSLKYSQTDWSIPEAFLGTLMLAAMADGEVRDVEIKTIEQLARRSRALRSLSDDELTHASASVYERVTANPETSLEEACHTLPADMCLPVFAHCVDIVLADGELVEAESNFLNKLVPLLDIEPDHAQRVKEVLLLKAQY